MENDKPITKADLVKAREIALACLWHYKRMIERLTELEATFRRDYHYRADGRTGDKASREQARRAFMVGVAEVENETRKVQADYDAIAGSALLEHVKDSSLELSRPIFEVYTERFLTAHEAARRAIDYAADAWRPGLCSDIQGHVDTVRKRLLSHHRSVDSETIAVEIDREFRRAAASATVEVSRAGANGSNGTNGSKGGNTPNMELAVDGNAAKVLSALLKVDPVLQKQTEISAACGISVDTVGDCLSRLEDGGFVERPMGERKGYRLTSSGKTLAQKHNS